MITLGIIICIAIVIVAILLGIVGILLPIILDIAVAIVIIYTGWRLYKFITKKRHK